MTSPIDGYFLELYIQSKRRMLGNKFIKLPVEGSKPYKRLLEVAKLIEELHAPPEEFLGYAVKYYSPLRIFPSGGHMLSRRFVQAFKRYQAIKRLYVYDDHSLNGDSVYIHATQETVSYKTDINCPADRDPRLAYAMHLAKNAPNIKTLDSKGYRDVCYAIVKLKCLNKPIPVELVELRTRFATR